MGRVILLSLILMQWCGITFGEENITFSFLNITDIKLNKTTLLRYGHHRTYKCQEFDRVYVCVMRCLEKGFDIAYLNKVCDCYCYRDKVKSKYFTRPRNWKRPTTTKPAWAVGDLQPGMLFGGELVLFSKNSSTNLKEENSNEGLQENITVTTEGTEIVQDTTLDQDNTGNDNAEAEETNAGEGKPDAGEEASHDGEEAPGGEEAAGAPEEN